MSAVAIRQAGNWHALSTYQKLCYLVNTKQARGFPEAGRMLSALKRPDAPKPVAMRFPYCDN